MAAGAVIVAVVVGKEESCFDEKGGSCRSRRGGEDRLRSDAVYSPGTIQAGTHASCF